LAVSQYESVELSQLCVYGCTLAGVRLCVCVIAGMPPVDVCVCVCVWSSRPQHWPLCLWKCPWRCWTSPLQERTNMAKASTVF